MQEAEPRPGPTGIEFLFRVPDEIPDDQEVAGELHLLDHADLALKTLDVLGQIVFEISGGAQGFETGPPLLESMARDVSEVRVDRMLVRHIKFREGLLDLLELHLAALGNIPGPRDGVFQLAEKAHHFVARLDVEVRMVPVHMGRIAHGLSGLDAHEDFVRARVVATQIVRVVGGDERNARLLRQPVDYRSEPLILLQAVILNFKEEIVLAGRYRHRCRRGVAHRRSGRRGMVSLMSPRRQADDPAISPSRWLLRQQVLVDARLAVEAFEIAGRYEIDQVSVAVLILTEQHQVVVAIGTGAGFVAFLRNVHLAADHRMHALRFSRVVETDRNALNRLPWSVMATAGIFCSTTRSISFEIFVTKVCRRAGNSQYDSAGGFLKGVSDIPVTSIAAVN